MCLKKILSFLIAIKLLMPADVLSQQLILQGERDSLFPVTNHYNLNADGSYSYQLAEVFNIASSNGKYYMFGNFTELATARGSALVLDSASLNINSASKWQINGTVYTSIPDGQGGFYIGGKFHRIGDSIRNNLAQIDKFGKPTSWNPDVDSNVNQIIKRNDTLFIGGVFRHISGVSKFDFAMYSLGTNTVLAPGGEFAVTLLQAGITSMLLNHDTIIYAGISYTAENSQVNTQPIRKFSFKNNSYLNWQIPWTQIIGDVFFLQFNQDSSEIIMAAEYDGRYIRAVSNATGVEIYKLKPSNGSGSTTNGSGTISGFKVIGNKAYVIGNFTSVGSTGNFQSRQNFASFNASTGIMATDLLPMIGYPSFMETLGNKIILSGKFSSINGVPRKNFAVVDTGTYNVLPMDFKPTDNLTSIGFSNGSIFIGGVFTGINAVQRNYFAAIDSATGNILPWSPVNTSFHYGKKMIIKGDSLFFLGKITDAVIGCMGDNYTTGFAIYSLSTGAQLSVGDISNNGMMRDFLIDGNKMYAAFDNVVRRFNIPNLTADNTWSFNLSGLGYAQTVTEIFNKGDTIVSVGDNRYNAGCGASIPRIAVVFKFAKSTGTVPSATYVYNENNYLYVQSIFRHGLVSGNKLFVQGKFDTLNTKARHNFACINVENGSITNWQAGFPSTVVGTNDLWTGRTSALKLFNGQIWFGGTIGFQLNDGSSFSGFGIVDTASGNLETPPLIKIGGGGYISDFFLNNNELTLAGSFDSINNTASHSLVRYKVHNTGSGNGGRTYTFIGNGNWNIAANWLNNEIPPATLPGPDAIVINPVAGGQCILNIVQTISNGAAFTVRAGSSFIVQGNLTIVE